MRYRLRQFILVFILKIIFINLSVAQNLEPMTEAVSRVMNSEKITRAELCVLLSEDFKIIKKLENKLGKKILHQTNVSAIDIQVHWAKPYITEILKIDNIGLGTWPDKSFKPDEFLTKGSFALIVELIYVKLTNGVNHWAAKYIFQGQGPRLPDVPKNHFAYSAMAFSIDKKILELHPNGEFRPKDYISGEEALIGLRRLEYVLRGQNPELATSNIRRNRETRFKTPQPKEPAQLTAEVSFFEPSDNNFLDAEETGKIIINLTNNGRGDAYNLLAKLLPQTDISEVRFSNPSPIDKILAGGMKRIEIPLFAGERIISKQIKLKLEVIEANGFDLDPPAYISFNTKALVPPELNIVDVGINDQSGNGQIEQREIVDITVRLQNIAQGDARNVLASIQLGENVFLGSDSRSSFDIGNLKPGEYRDFVFSIYTNSRATGVPINISIKEARERFNKLIPLNLPFNKQYKKATELIVEGKHAEPVEILNVATLSVDIAKDIPITQTKSPEAYAVVIGNRDYLKVKNVDFAINDATVVKEYLIKTFGFRDENIFFIKNATKADFELYFGTKGNPRGKLFNNIRPDGTSDVFVFYSGHGSPDVNDQKGYFVPVDSDPQYIGVSGYSLDLLYENLAQLPAKSVSVVLDACFSGSGLLEHISPVRIKFTNALMSIKNGVVISSSTGDQVSSWYPEKRHGMFTYFFLKAIHNKNADVNKDDLITLEEIYNFVTDANEGVPRYARKLHNVEQNPTILGDKSRILVRY